jgi:valyl-tRNA synthetase
MFEFSFPHLRCCALKTAISDIEVDTIELAGKTKRKVPGYEGNGFDFGIIEDFGYDVVDAEGHPILDVNGQPEVIVISTTRLETMLGDSAVAIHPDDERYKKFHGKYVFHPYRKVPLPIILDSELVKMDIGTGCVKVTPAHDPNDYQCGKRHNLPFLNILTDEGCINGIGGDLFAGKKRYDARIAIRKDLQAKGRHYAIRDNPMVLSVCSRSGDIIEPLLKPQWWVNCDSMAKEVLYCAANF